MAGDMMGGMDKLPSQCPSCGDYGADITAMGDSRKKYLCVNPECPNPGRWEGELTLVGLTLGRPAAAGRDEWPDELEER